DHDRRRAVLSNREQPEVDEDAEADRPDQGDHALIEARWGRRRQRGARRRAGRPAPQRLRRTKKIRRAGRGFVHNPGRLSVSALASRLVRPPGAASSYSRAVLGARGNVWPPETCRKGPRSRKTRNLRTLNNQHFHSPLCILWITGLRVGERRRASGRMFLLDITPLIVQRT